MIIGRETKENIRIFKDMYKELESYEQDATSINQSYKAIKVHHKGDMSAQWNLTKKGGACKNAIHFRLCCALKSEMVHVPADPPCDYCVERLPSAPDTACYSHDFVDIQLLNSYHLNTHQIVASLTKELRPPERNGCHLYLSENSIAADCTKDLNCVDFEPETLEESMAFSDFLKDDLVEPDMSRFGNLEQRREALKERIMQERDLEDLRKTVDHCARHLEALDEVMKLIPCILHLEIR
jgi:hypothetical protein